ncbi:uncharacterized protein LOC131355069 [Hemibagrus wyckioides]|uniref:uncharacterized protein LOC131355069 n=1 Tax=Hemibagrus wyckioides TaxID=337641 RepID=UPI00266DB807|nr:uncharacterized protein LOC131355069 [Hemibagrus wyckioides]
MTSFPPPTDCTESYENVIPCQMNRTAFKGETVILHCNGNLTSKRTIVDFGWRKDRTLLFIYSPDKNETVTNYTSSRMQVDPRNPRKLQISDVQPSDAGLYSCFPLDMQCILTIEDSPHTEIQEKVGSFYVVFSVSTVCLFIFCAVCFHGKCKGRAASDPTKTSNELAYKDYVHHSTTQSYENVIPHQMNRTAVDGETVILHCDGNLTSELVDFGWRKDRTLVFSYSPHINQTVIDYTSSRMQVDPQENYRYLMYSLQMKDYTHVFR